MEFFDAYCERVDGATASKLGLPNAPALLTGPTTSPENSYRFEKNATARKYAWGFVALMPAIDVAVLYRVCDAYLELCDRAKGCAHREAARRLTDGLPNKGRPLVRDGRIDEYPATPGVAFDDAHRHWSGLWALYPGRQLSPWDKKDEAYAAAAASLHAKLAAGGGHTGWSRAWAACLAARTLDGALLETQLLALVGEFFMANLLATHPPLKPTFKGQKCETCFDRAPPPAKPAATQGTVTKSGDVFQLDGNLGFLAAVVEGLLQSHRGSLVDAADPVELHLLPALPPSWSDGAVTGLRARGGYEVDVAWSAGRLANATIKAVDAAAPAVVRLRWRGRRFAEARGLGDAAKDADGFWTAALRASTDGSFLRCY